MSLSNNKDYKEVFLDELTAEQALDIAIESISDAIDWLPEIKPRKNAVAIMELLQQTLTLLDFYLAEKQIEYLECDINEDEMTRN